MSTCWAAKPRALPWCLIARGFPLRASASRTSSLRSAATTATTARAAWMTSEKPRRSEEHTSELQSQSNVVCRLLLEKKKIEDSKQEDKKLCREQSPQPQP